MNKLVKEMETISDKKLCIFSHYFDGDYVPFYVLVYINELKKYFDELIIVTNERTISNKSEILDTKTTLFPVKNEGYDFGMFYKALKTIDTQDYSQIACINDSNIVFGSLEFLFSWGNNQYTDFWGLVDSWQKPKVSEHEEYYHVQSHFLVFNRNAIDMLPKFLEQIDFKNLVQIKDQKLLRKKVIEIWEIGVSRFLLKNNLKCKTYINSKDYSNTFYNGQDINVTIKLYDRIVKLGIPIIKRRLVVKKTRLLVIPKKLGWKKLILKYADKNFQPKRIITDLQQNLKTSA